MPLLRSSWQQLPAYLLASFFLVYGLTGCAEGDYRPRAIGTEGEVVVVIDSTRWKGEIGEAVRETIGSYVSTLPTPERQFDLKPVNLRTKDDLERVRRYKNVVFVAPLSDTTNEAKYLKNVFDAEAQQAILSGQQAVIGRPDLWRRDQVIYYVSGATPEDVVTALHTHSDRIVGAFNDVTRQRVEREMFEKGRQPEIEEYLMEHHGFAVKAQHDYLVAADTSNFTWLRRILSDTWRSLFVYYIEDADPSKLSPQWIYAMRDSLTRQHIQGNVMGWVEIDERRPLESEEINFLGRYGFESRGLWHMVGEQEGQQLELGMGGPFVTYTFYDEPSGRIYMIDGMVFAPKYSKREFLRHMEVIAHTFHTRHDVAQRAAAE